MAGRRILIYSPDALNLSAFLEQMEASADIAFVKGFTDAASLCAEIKDSIFDAVIVDEDAEVCSLLREKDFAQPVLLIGSAPDEGTFNENVTDFIEKPFKFNALLARLYQCVCQYESADKTGFIIGPYTFSPLTKSIENTVSGQQIRLTEKEAEILSYLYRAKGNLVDKDELLREVWGYNSEVTTHTLETHVYRLRQKINQDDTLPLIISETGGYRIDKKFLKTD